MSSGDVVIDLGAAEPWTAPDAPPPARRRWLVRWVAAVVLGLVAGLLPGAAAPDARPLLHLEIGVQRVVMGGGLMFVTRYTGEGPHRLETYDTGSGRWLWGADLGDGQQQVVGGDANVVLIDTAFDGRALAFSQVQARDARTGAELWQRASASVDGLAGGVVLLQDLTSFRQVDVDGGEPPTGMENRIVAVDARTGEQVWELVVPGGSQASFERDAGKQAYAVRSVAVLDPGGALRVHDVRTGAVVRTSQLAWSGNVGMFVLGDRRDLPQPAGARGGQVAVSAAAGFRYQVYDLTSGRLVWQIDAEQSAWIFGCAPGWWCTGGNQGMTGYDAATGAPVWHSEGGEQILGIDGARLVVGGVGADGLAVPGVRIVDTGTGATTRRLERWRPLFGFGDRLTVFWHEEGRRVTVVGQLDARTGRVTVLGRTETGAGEPTCDNDARSVACVIAGDLTLWRAAQARAGGVAS
ncbi:MAG TPA: PQQ-binding-like beta-propeller repeat protein [Dactylosporangium sp.]|nr:PQQ-binding-like beta-propeller repeat protein [Dactylosporangium sp.]